MKQIKKSDLPVKICKVCNRAFTWRKKWEKVWEDVKYCSEKCRIKPTTDLRAESIKSSIFPENHPSNLHQNGKFLLRNRAKSANTDLGFKNKPS